MSISIRTKDLAAAKSADVLIPMIRTAATIGFAIAPCSLGFVIIAVSEQLIRSIMVADDPESLVSQLQQRFPHAALEVNHDHDAALVASVVDIVERVALATERPSDPRGGDFQPQVWAVL
jgi:AraC family transcriptional regulator of adaptative response/methylated-DNA-[protein]-cysteine methyltransferase